MFKFELYSVYQGRKRTSEGYRGSFDTLAEVIFMAYVLGETNPNALFRIAPFDVFIRPHGVTVKNMYDYVYNKIF